MRLVIRCLSTTGNDYTMCKERQYGTLPKHRGMHHNPHRTQYQHANQTDISGTRPTCPHVLTAACPFGVDTKLYFSVAPPKPNGMFYPRPPDHQTLVQNAIALQATARDQGYPTPTNPPSVNASFLETYRVVNTLYVPQYT